MKVDGLGVVLAIILLPIILVVSYYIQLQVDTIATENSYNTKLLDATYDAMYAFESNTANEELSSVADSLRSIILASNNVLLNSLATNLGISNASKEHLQPYIPAVLYTLYDGYYIYAPTETPVVARNTQPTSTDGLVTSKEYLFYKGETSGIHGVTNDTVYGDILYEYDTQKHGNSYTYTVDKEHAKTKTDYVLKSYVQYSARYVKNNIDVTINYTLDNYLNIVGTIGNVYYTKTGYLIKKNLVTDVTIDGPYNLKQNNEDMAKEKILGKKTNASQTTIDAAKEISVKINGDQEAIISAKWEEIINPLKNMYNDANIKTVSEAETYLKRAYEEGKDNTQIQNLEYAIGKYKSVAYYVSSAIFSDWVYSNLGELQYNHIKDDAVSNYYTDTGYETTSGAGQEDLYYNFDENSTLIFDGDDPEDTESAFNTHKMEVIKNSIKYNLNLSISAYCKMKSAYQVNAYDFSMPVLLDEEWDKILKNISIVSFMQGWDCGLNIYNNYEMVSSTNNELMVTPNEIYYVEKENFNKGGDEYYHRIDCNQWNTTGKDFISFKSKEVKYDRISDSKTHEDKYDHKNLACYTCINSNNYDSSFKLKTDPWYGTNNRKYSSYYDRIFSLGNPDLRKAGYIGLAKERQNVYKTNALPVSEGYKIIYDNDSTVINNTTNISPNLNNTPSIKLEDIQKLEIIIAETESKNTAGSTEPILKLRIQVGNQQYEPSLNLDQPGEQAIVLDIPSYATGTINSISFGRISPNYNVSYKVKSIKAIYK